LARPWKGFSCSSFAIGLRFCLPSEAEPRLTRLVMALAPFGCSGDAAASGRRRMGGRIMLRPGLQIG
jgi:hypothetical protein